MASVKEEILEWAQSLPENCSWEDLQYFLYVRGKVAEGLKDVEQGRVVSHEEAKRRMAAWLKSSGLNQP